MDKCGSVWLIKHFANSLEEKINAREKARRAGEYPERYDSNEAIKRIIRVMRDELLKLYKSL